MKFKEFNNLEELNAYLNGDEIEDFVDNEEYPVENEKFGNDFALMFEPVYKVKRSGKTYLVMEGVYMTYDKKAGGAYPDWDISMVYEDTEDEDFDPSNFLYYEQGSAVSAVMNFCNALNTLK